MLEWKQDIEQDWTLYAAGTRISWVIEAWDFEDNQPIFEVANIKDEDQGHPTYKTYKTLAGAKREGMKQAKAWLEELLRAAG